MKYVALLSGGKDSCFNVVHCNANGHVLVAAASLRPQHGKEEIDSYLYQTVGQDAIEFVAQALDVPLYRKTIVGQAVEQGSEYGTRTDHKGVEGDETEDLYELLSLVKTHHPDVEAVSVGAILSNYQRVRVEHVCRRLNLTSLAYLWQRDQGQLLSEMIESGVQAILIKVAGIGLTVQHLGKTLAEMEPTLLKLNTLYGSHICGEGGEYESLTLDCPAFKSRIELVETEQVIHSDSGFATVAYLRVKNAKLVPKEPQEVSLTIPSILEDGYCHIVEETQSDKVESDPLDIQPTPLTDFVDLFSNQTSSTLCNNWVTVSNVQHEGDGISLEEEVEKCFTLLQEHLAKHSLDLSHISFISIYLLSLDLFAPLNAIYGTYFATSPPARACVMVDLPKPIRVRLDCVAFKHSDPQARQALHVQGISYWAPANIGPYSQAVVTDERIHISGQIGLIPSSMTLPTPPSIKLETALCFQHCTRVLNALREGPGGGWVGHVQAALYWVSSPESLYYARQAHGLVKEQNPPATLYLTVKELPKGALVEKQVIGHTGRMPSIDEDGQAVIEDHEPKHVNFYSNGLYWQGSILPNSKCAIVCGRLNDNFVSEELCSLCTASSVRFFYVPAKFEAESLSARRILEALQNSVRTNIPCRRISSLFDDWDFALLLQTNGLEDIPTWSRV